MEEKHYKVAAVVAFGNRFTVPFTVTLKGMSPVVSDQSHQSIQVCVEFFQTRHRNRRESPRGV